MRRTVRSRAEEQFAAAQKKSKDALKDKEKAHKARMAQIDNLRKLRLAKEAMEAEPAANDESELEQTVVPEAPSPPNLKLPQAH